MMLIFWWWLDVWQHWLSVLEVATPPPTPEHPPDGCHVINMAHWQRTHPDHTPGHNGWAA